MTIRLESPTTITKTEFDRLFEEAHPKLSIERQRMGGKEELREALWAAHQNETDKVGAYYKDDYLVGCRVARDWYIGDEKFEWYIQPTYGTDQNGSRSWWYSEDTRKAMRDFCVDNGYAGAIAIHNPTSPAAEAVASHFAHSYDGRQYFQTAETRTISEVFPDIDMPLATDSMRVFVLRITDSVSG